MRKVEETTHRVTQEPSRVDSRESSNDTPKSPRSTQFHHYTIIMSSSSALKDVKVHNETNCRQLTFVIIHSDLIGSDGHDWQRRHPPPAACETPRTSETHDTLWLRVDLIEILCSLIRFSELTVQVPS